MIYFCTYFDKNYLSRFLTLEESLNKFDLSYTFYVLGLDNEVYDFFKKNHFENIRIISLIDFEKEYEKLSIAKNNRDLIEYYFTLSPFLPRYIFKNFNIRKISYLDADFYFFKNPKLKIEENSDYSAVLLKQYSDQKYGLYNVGWIYYNFDHNETKDILKLWSAQCLKFCTDFPSNGFYADQKYLDMWPTKLRNLKIEEPENYCLSPWDSNKIIENNFENIYAYHFHGLEINKEYFVTGFSNYNKKNTDKIISKVYAPYLKKLISIENKFNLKNSSLRNVSNNKYKFFKKKIRKIKADLKRKYYKDFYDFKVLS